MFDIELAGGFYAGDISDAIGGLSADFGVGKVGQWSFEAVDVDRTLTRAGLTTPGRMVRIGGAQFDVAAIARDYRGDDIWLTVEMRSSVARRLRLMSGSSRETDVTPAQWITKRVRKAGGTALVEPGAKRRTIAQKRNESVLDVIAALASDTSTEWVEYGGTVYVGTAWWAFQGKTGLPTWQVSMRGGTKVNELTGLRLDTRESIDDREVAADATLTVDQRLGIAVQPWSRVNLADVPEPDAGLWLVSNVAFAYGGGDVTLNLQRPLKSSPQDGSSGESGGGASGSLSELDGEWIQNADRAIPPCTRSPRQYVAAARAQLGRGYAVNRCLRWVSEVVSGSAGRGGDYARYVWERAPSSAVKSPKDFSPPIGAIVVWGAPTGGSAGHIGISVGGGRFISATGGRVIELPIKGFGTGGDGSYYGAMTPSFWT